MPDDPVVSDEECDAIIDSVSPGDLFKVVVIRKASRAFIRAAVKRGLEIAKEEAAEVSTGDRGIERHEIDAWLRGSNSTRAGIVAAIEALAERVGKETT